MSACQEWNSRDTYTGAGGFVLAQAVAAISGHVLGTSAHTISFGVGLSL